MQSTQNFTESSQGFLRLASLPTYDDKVSRPGEFHPQALAEPCVNLSAHTAPIIQP